VGRVTIQLSQPAALGTGVRKAGVQQTLGYLPGTVLRGALAARWIAEHDVPTIINPRREEFVRLFEGDVVFGPLLPPDAVPMPRSCWVHKYEAEAGCPLWIDEATGMFAPADRTCPHCSEPVQPASGELTTIRDGQLASATRTVEDTHVAIDEQDRAKDGQLFTRRRLRRDQSFYGHLTGPADDVELAVSLGEILWLGGRRSTSGRARLHHDPTDAPQSPDMINSQTVVLRLASPGIFVNELGQPQTAPSDSELSGALGVHATVVRRWTRWMTISGWHVASGLPKPAEAAVSPGGTYWVRCAETPDPGALRGLAMHGLGLRRIEGYGALIPGPDSVLAGLLPATVDTGEER
jgi:CRISPR-associated protein Csx10